MRILPLTIFSLTLSLSTAHAAPPRQVTTVEGISEYALDNGLRVLVFPDRSKPTITVNVTYFVGSRHEGYGETGMAHLIEHMMFKSSKKYSKIGDELEKRGANLNGTTDVDRTNYFEILPATGDNLAFALDLEADRMVTAKILASDLKSEFSVVRNEFEMGESAPPEVLEERMLESAYLWHNYGKPTIGSRSDIERVQADTLHTFYRKYYQPDNAMLVVAGKFEAADALKLIAEKFGKIPRPKRKLAPTYTVEPVQDGERAVTLRRSGDVQVAGIMYHSMSGASSDYAAATAVAEILTAQPAGRLYQALVETGMAAAVRGQATPWLEPGIFDFFADVRTDKPVDKVRDKMIEVTEGLAKTKITDEELERWRKKTLREIELGLTNPERVGIELSEWAALGDWRMKFVFRDRVKTVTTADVQRVAAQFLKQSNRTVGLFLPTAAPDRAPLPDQPEVKKMVADYKGQDSMSAGEIFVATLDNIEKRTERVTLPSGMKLALLPKKTRGGSVEIMLHVRAGSESDLKGLTEVGELMTDMVTRGTKKHSFQQIKDELDKLKAELKPNQGMEGGSRPGSSVFRIQTVRENVPAVLALLAEIVREPSFPKDEFEKLRKEQLAKMEEMMNQPMMAGFVALLSKSRVWPKDDVRYIPSIPERVERLKLIRPEQLADYHRKLWGAAGATLVVVGDIDAVQLKPLVESQFDGWKALRPYQRIATPYHAAPSSDETIKTPDKQMAFVGAALPVEMRDDDPEYPAFLFADFIYGGSGRSRLWDRLREKEGLSYGTFSFVDADAFDQNGFFLSGAICAPQNAAKAMTGIIEEIGKLVDKGVADGELKEHKKAYQAKFDNDLANDEGVVMLLDEALITNRTLAFQSQLNGKIQALSSSQVVAAMKKWVKPESLIKIKVGDL